MPRNPVGEGPVWRHTRDYYTRLNELRYSHPHISVRELELFLNNPPPSIANETPKAPAPEPPKVTQAQRIWPYLP
jgi:hypothetical protein